MKKALIIGIDNYPEQPLAGCVRDANSMANVLEANGDGSPNFSVKLVTSPNQQLDKAALRKSVEDLFKGDNETALFYFSGHGHIDSTGGYLVTTDTQRYDEGLAMDVILGIANKSPAKNKVIILDCCYSGAAGSPAIVDGNIAMLSEGLSVLTSSRGTETSQEVDGQGVFTSLVVDALRGGGADLRGNITPGSLYAYVDEALGAWDQRPIFKTNITRLTTLRTVKPQVSLDILRRIVDYFPDPTSQHNLDPTYEDTVEGFDDNKVVIFKELQQLEGIGLVVPEGEEHMYYAAINSKACRLTAMGAQYWRLAKEKKL